MKTNNPHIGSDFDSFLEEEGILGEVEAGAKLKVSNLIRGSKMKKLKLETRVIVNGVETFISELHADITRGVYKVRTSNPTYEFTKNSKGEWWAYPCEGQDAILLEEAPKYGNYQVGDRIQLTLDTWIAKKGYKGTVTAIEPERLVVTYDNSYLAKEGFNLDGSYSFAGKTSKPILKKLRVKLGEKR